MADQPESSKLSGQAQAAIVAGIFGLFTLVLTQWDKMPWNAGAADQSESSQADIISNSMENSINSDARQAVSPVAGSVENVVDSAAQGASPAQITTSSVSPAPPTGRFALANANSGLCLSPAGGGQNPNDQIVQYLCDGEPSRYWRFITIDGTIVKIMNLDNRLCLTVAGGSPDRNVAAVQYHCDDDPSRRWNYEVVNPTRFRLRNVNSGLCLTVAGGSTDRNVVAVQYLCDGDPSRAWEFPR